MDSSVWVALLAQEASAERLKQWLDNEDGLLFTALWTRTELASALSIKARRGELTQKQVTQLLQEFEQWVATGVQLLTVDNGDFACAAELCARVKARLRSGDALHLTVASRHQMTHVSTLDHEMIENALKMGLQVMKYDDRKKSSR
jgi:hypothetical protein